jgi:mono/diheme cytochrome c family protein
MTAKTSLNSGFLCFTPFFQGLIVGLVVFNFFLLTGCQDKNYAKVPEESQISETTHEQKVKRGEYLVTTIGCADCHSPKKVGERGPEEIKGLELSGYPQGRELPTISGEALKNGWILMSGDLTAAVGPWGVSFASNITSDETGIGTWSLEQFKTSIRKGKFKGMENGRDLLPPMPWFNFALLTDEDLEAMYHYLQSTEPVENVVPAPIPPTELVMN